MESALLIKIMIGFVFQLLVTCGAVIFAVRLGLTKLQVRVEDMGEDVKSIEDKVDIINGRVDRHDTKIAVHDERLDNLSVV